jgi:hypothetical protein
LPSGGAGEASAEDVLAAGIKAQIVAHLRAARFEETDQSAIMVEVSMAEDQRIDSGRVDFHDLEVVGIDLGGEAEIQQIAPRFPAPLRFDVQRETPFAVERLALRRTRSGACHGEAGELDAAQKHVVRAVGDFLHDDPVDDRRVNAGGRGSGSSADTGGNQRSAQRSRGLQETPAV